MGQAPKGQGGGMDKTAIKSAMRVAIRQPIHAAFAIGADGKAVIHLDKVKQGRSLLKNIKEGDPKAKEHRFGMVTVDPEDPKLARFQVNKAGGGLARKLMKGLKGTGFTKVIIVLEDGSPVEEAEGSDDEDEDDEDERHAGHGHGGHEGGAHGHHASADDEDSADDTSEDEDEDEDKTARGDEDEADADEEEEGGKADQPDPKELAHTLTGLVKRMIGVIAKDPTKKAALAELATDAQASLKRGDLEQASAGIDILREALDGGSGDAEGDGGRGHAHGADPHGEGGKGGGRGKHAAGSDAEDGGDAGHAEGKHAEGKHAEGGHAGAGGEGGHGAKTAEEHEKHHKTRQQKAHKSRSAWMATKGKVEEDLKKLKAEIMKATQGDSLGEELEKSFHNAVEPVLKALDDKLAHALEAAAKAAAAEEHERHLAEAHKIIERYHGFISSNETIAHLDKNPFMPLQVSKLLSNTLKTLKSALH